MSNSLTDDALDQLFRNARTYRSWLDKPVSEETLRGYTSCRSGGRRVPMEVQVAFSLFAHVRQRSD
jgi:hypothetical protein